MDAAPLDLARFARGEAHVEPLTFVGLDGGLPRAAFTRECTAAPCLHLTDETGEWEIIGRP
jgi:hypothetical protein